MYHAYKKGTTIKYTLLSQQQHCNTDLKPIWTDDEIFMSKGNRPILVEDETFLTFAKSSGIFFRSLCSKNTSNSVNGELGRRWLVREGFHNRNSTAHASCTFLYDEFWTI